MIPPPSQSKNLWFPDSNSMLFPANEPSIRGGNGPVKNCIVMSSKWPEDFFVPQHDLSIRLFLRFCTGQDMYLQKEHQLFRETDLRYYTLLCICYFQQACN